MSSEETEYEKIGDIKWVWTGKVRSTLFAERDIGKNVIKNSTLTSLFDIGLTFQLFVCLEYYRLPS